jgi:hypothetical protein
MSLRKFSLSGAFQLGVVAVSVVLMVGLTGMAIYFLPAAYEAAKAGNGSQNPTSYLPLATTAAALVVYSMSSRSRGR